MFIEKRINIVSARSLLTLYKDMQLETHHRKIAGKIDSYLTRVYAIIMRLIAAVKCRRLNRIIKRSLGFIVSAFGIFA